MTSTKVETKKTPAKTLTADSEPGNNNKDGTHPTVAMAKGGEGTSDNEEEDTDDVATVDGIDEGGD
jgi:hypothetical protein